MIRILKHLAAVLLLVSVSSASEPAANLKWFDGEGCFHYGDPLQYLNSVLSGNQKDDVLLDAMRTVFPGIQQISIEQLSALSEKLASNHSAAAIYYPDKKIIKKLHKEMISEFDKNKLLPPGSIVIEGFGVKVQGPIQLFKGSSRNVMIAIPADPKIIEELTDIWKDISPEADRIFDAVLKKKPWKTCASVKIPDPMGRAIFDGLTPGNWLIWVNQFNMLTYLYRVNVETGRETNLQLRRVFAYHKLQMTK
jgi:hypothetical protein